MSHTLSTLTALQETFSLQQAEVADLPAILAIYNQNIASKQATADLVPVTQEARKVWFYEHINNPKRPIYVLKTLHQLSEPTLVAWGSFSDLYARPAYHISSEISVYVHQDYHGQGLGRRLILWMLSQAPSLGIDNVVALIFAHNAPSLRLFCSLGFEQWGHLPQVCDMDGFIADVLMLGRALTLAKEAP